MTPEQLIDTSTRYQVLLEQLKAGMAGDFTAGLSEIDDLLATALSALRVDKLGDITRANLNVLIEELTQLQVEAFDRTIDNFMEKMPELATQVEKFETNAVRSVMKPKERTHMVRPPAGLAHKEALKRPVQATGEPLEDMIKNWSNRAIQRTNNAVRIGYDQGQTVPQIIKRLIGTEGMRKKDGLGEVTRREARTVVRTAVQHVAATAREVTWEENNDLVEGVEWVSTLDSKTTPQCRALDGRKFKLKEGPRPPIHPNCRSTTAPDLTSEFDFLDEGATRSSQDGYVDAEETYYSWLKKQSTEFQDEVLGPMRGKLFRDGGLSADEFARLQLDKNFKPITLAEMKEKAPLAFQRAGLMHPEFTFDDGDAEDVHPNAPGFLVNAAVPNREVQPFLKQIGKLDDENASLTEAESEIVQAMGDTKAEVKQVLRKDGKVAAAVSFGVTKEDGFPDRMEVFHLGSVSRGGGTAGLKLAAGAAQEKDMELVLNSREGAQEFYFKLGFKVEDPYYPERLVLNKAGVRKLLDVPHPRPVPKPNPTPAPVVTAKELPGRPKEGTATGKVWTIGDTLHAKLGRMPTRPEMLEAAKEFGINESTVSVQFGKWKKAFGANVTGIPVPTPPPAAEPIKKAAEALQIFDSKVAKLPEPPLPRETAPPTTPTGKTNAEKWAEFKGALDGLQAGTVRKVSHHEMRPVHEAMAKLVKKYGDDNGVPNLAAMPSSAKLEYLNLNAKIREYAADVEFAEKQLADPRNSRHAVHDYMERLVAGEGRAELGIRMKPLENNQAQFFVAEPTAEQKKRMQDATEFVSRVTHPKLLKSSQGKPIEVYITKDRTSTESSYGDMKRDIKMAHDATTRIWCHEIAHHLEYESGRASNGQNLKRITEWLEKRRGKEKLRSIKGHYKIFDDEWTARGGRNYASRTYTNPFSNSKEITATEVISCGMERMYENPVEFYQQDPDHFEITARTILDLW